MTISDDTSSAWCVGGDRLSLSCESLDSECFLEGEGSLQLRRSSRSVREPTGVPTGPQVARAGAESRKSRGEALGESEMKSGKLDRC